MNTFDTQINKNSLVSVQEVGLKELLQEASKYYDENNFANCSGETLGCI